jgi:hypothetical protein
MLAFPRATGISPARSQHADDDRCQEGEGDNGGEHVEPHPEGHSLRPPAGMSRLSGAVDAASFLEAYVRPVWMPSKNEKSGLFILKHCSKFPRSRTGDA